MDDGVAYDPATGISVGHPFNTMYVRAPVQVIGPDLVMVGWDLNEGELNSIGQVVAASLDLDDPDAQWRTSKWPLPPPGLESIKTATDGTDLLVMVWASNPDVCAGPQSCHRLLRFTPSTGAWTDLGVYPHRLQDLSSGGGRVYGTANFTASGQTWDDSSFAHVVEVEPDDGSVTSLGNPGSYGHLLVSDTGRLALVGGADIRVRNLSGQWQALPAVPGDPLYPAVVWAGDDLLVWGGAAALDRPGSHDVADGWIFRSPT
ncbi:hypothetical protein ACFQ46_22700 [Kineococcus sp. GCM10028916]|uniref:hypothetical protein n=1 Tax=Kineococcus sp. GCM10028916 TaxID=3273394 RepID=UPI00363CB611